MTKLVKPKKIRPRPFTGNDLEVIGSVMPYRHALPWVWSDNPEDSIHYWWFQYLRRNDEYRRCCAAGGEGRMGDFFRDWGNVFTEEIEEWFLDHGAHLFAERDIQVSQLRESAQLSERYLRSNVVLVCPTDVEGTPISESAIRAQFEKYLSENFAIGKREQWSTAKYRIQGAHDPRVLKEMLTVYDARITEDWSFSEIGEKLLNEGKISIGHSYHTSSSKKVPEYNKAAERKKMTKVISRYFYTAQQYIESAVGRSFPVEIDYESDSTAST